MTDQDRRFVVGSWAASFRDSHSAGPIPFELYDSIYRDQVIPWMLARPGVTVWVAYHPGEDDPRLDIHGWIAVERGVEVQSRVRVPDSPGRRRWETARVPTNQPLVLWIFVKAAKRRLGIARRLFAIAGVDPEQPFLFAFKPAAWPALRHLAPLATWQPSVVRREKTGAKESDDAAQPRTHPRPSRSV
jgi:GNAT superfamily N-acetyltransferase